MVSFLAVTQVLFVVGLVATVLMHSGRDAGMGGMGFTPTSQGGTHIVERNLTRVTLVFAILFVANSVTLFHYLK
ncbi:MAG TPA: preprotein translocase subunit SecG [Gaiellaceae bacterium]|nr:preprotein translocase subunit SecG [Gaiellaceae bacterium]